MLRRILKVSLEECEMLRFVVLYFAYEVVFQVASK